MNDGSRPNCQDTQRSDDKNHLIFSFSYPPYAISIAGTLVRDPYEDWEITLGDLYTDRSEGTEQVFGAESVFYYDSYGRQKDSSMYDIGLIKLTGNVDLTNANVQVISVPPPNYAVTSPSAGVVAGWGDTQSKGKKCECIILRNFYGMEAANFFSKS